ncbi:MAG: RagB/SusD family nutrient uptake outer membrane protein [Prevotella sp.]|nr:RagB/SusD family nutrient uptake outer membrane protein [Prevotella sp.]
MIRKSVQHKWSVLSYILLSLIGGGWVGVFSSCDNYLDELPDNRSELTSEDKVQKLLTSCYLTNDPLLVAEVMSDNVDSYGDNNPNTSRFMDQLYHWKDITETNNESPEMLWEDCYERIASANLALQAIDELGGATTTALQQAKGEALVCRAYLHFVLVNIFGHAYNSQTSEQDLGVVYLSHTVEKLDANPPRNSVAEVYRLIDRDLQEGLPLVGSDYSVPKYHFNQKAAYAFAARFYLYYEQWQKAIDYATRCLGSAPQAMLRDWAYVATMTQTSDAITQHYIDASLNCNLLLCTGYSAMGLIFGPYRYMSKYSHGKYLATHEDGEAANIWGTATPYQGMHTYSASNLDKTIYWKLPYLFEYTDAVAGIGYYHTVYPAFTCDEALLNRAEAYVLTEQYDKAAQDLTIWMQNYVSTSQVLTPAVIQSFYNGIDYAYGDAKGIASTIKKHLNPKFDIGAEGDMKEAMLQCVLGLRRMETLQTGLRWYDVKRYGIEIVRRTIDADGNPDQLIDVLKVDDPRRAVQIPMRARESGVQANPR